MTSPAPSGFPAHARDAVAALFTAPTVPAKHVVVGGIGTGKTAVLAVIRAALRDAGVDVRTRPPAGGERISSALLIDDAHLLTDAELEALTERVADPGSTIVAATEPRHQHGALRAFIVAMERENPAVALGVLEKADLQRATVAALGGPPSAELAGKLVAATAGLPFLVHAALAALGAGDDDAPGLVISRAARYALVDRLGNLDESTLDALLIASLSPDLGAADLAAALRVSPDIAQTLMDSARGSGLIAPSHTSQFLRSVHRAVAQTLGAARHHDVEKSLLTTQLDISAISTDLALRLAEHGMRDDHLAEILERAALSDESAHAARLYRAAVNAGAANLGARLADTLALTGDCRAAGRLADGLLASEDPAERAAAVRIAATVAFHDGNAGQAADLFRWLGPHPDALVSSAGAVALVAAGDSAAARASLSAQGPGPPTSAARAAHGLADGLLLTLDQPFAVAISRLGQALSGDEPGLGAVPDTPAALVTLVALHGGDPVRARSVIGREVRSAGDELFAHRHRLLLGWVKMLDGQLASALSDADAVDAATLHRRDALWSAALRTGIARRSGDGGAVHKHWYAAMDVLSEYSIDLFALLPLGELWVAAARLRQVDRLQHSLDEAFALLDTLGNPVLWSVPLHWAGVHAGILANSPQAVAPHGHVLTSAAESSAFAKSLAGAGRVWLRVLANHVDADEVTAAARGLAGFGQTWDATRLASQAALQTPDPRVAAAMLQLARDLKMTTDVPSAQDSPTPSTSAGTATRQAQSGVARLSDREREVAELLLLGMPYRDIGAQLFISAKTVEHHVARIRRRFGAESRSEMLSMLRAMLATQP